MNEYENDECMPAPLEKRLVDQYQLEELVRQSMNIGWQHGALVSRVWAELEPVEGVLEKEQ